MGAIALSLPVLVAAAEFYVSPTAAVGGDGTIANPWTLATALTQPSAVQPGDTIWLRGGTYGGTFSSALTGTADAPIILRQYPGERATIDGGDSQGMPIFVVGGAYAWYWGFEVTSSDPNRISQQASSNPSDIGRGEGVVISQTPGSAVGTKFINLVIHDTRQGVSFWKEAIDSEIYGSLIYYNGWHGPRRRPRSRDLRAESRVGPSGSSTTSSLQFGQGLHAYGSATAYLDNIYLEGNTVVNNGESDHVQPAQHAGRRRCPGEQPHARRQSLYYPNGAAALHRSQARLRGTCSTLTMTNNYVANNSEFVCTGMTISANTFYGAVVGFNKTDFPNNSYLTARPTTNAVFVRPNVYEFGRANITIFNWDASELGRRRPDRHRISAARSRSAMQRTFSARSSPPAPTAAGLSRFR